MYPVVKGRVSNTTKLPDVRIIRKVGEYSK
jgi:hypothetical protein